MNESTLCEDRVIAITGAGRGIGRAYALALAASGARVYVRSSRSISEREHGSGGH